MIKIESDKIYMTAGDACYILRVSDELYAEHFGTRIELEDDLTVLYGERGIKEFDPDITVGGKKVKLAFDGASVLEQKPHRASAIDGGKTLVVKMCSADRNITAEIYYTPYPRGGFSRRVVLTNGTNGVIKAKRLNTVKLGSALDILSLTDEGEAVLSDCCVPSGKRSMNNFAAAVGKGFSYGFLSVYGDGEITARVGGVTEIDCRECDCVSVAAGESYMSPEALCVYSDRGTDGMTRIFHDIIRESLGSKFLAERRPVVMFCPVMPRGKMVSAAGVTGELGCDVFAVDIGATDIKTLAALSAACKDAGIKLGARIDPFNIKKTGAVYGSRCKKTDGDVYSCDLVTEAGFTEFFDSLGKAVRDCDIEYLTIDVPLCGIQSVARGVYMLRHTLRQTFGELIVEWGIIPEKLRGARLMCYPPCTVRSAVTADGPLKAAFDNATFGCLGYGFDPNSLSDELKRAVRAQVFSYQDDAPTVMLGDLYKNFTASGDVCMTAVSKDKSKAYIVCKRTNKAADRIKLEGLDEHNLYRVRELNKTFSGAALVTCGVPLIDSETACMHIRQVADYE